jgi:hypothetical protein
LYLAILSYLPPGKVAKKKGRHGDTREKSVMTHLILPFSVRNGLGAGFLAEAAEVDDERLGTLEGLTVMLE